MSYPAFNNPTSTLYNDYSFDGATFPEMPAWFNRYEPLSDNQPDFTCMQIWQPAPERGAREWANGYSRVLLGVYMDEGRDGDYSLSRVVVRALPSFRLLTAAEFAAILAETEPVYDTAPLTLTDIITGNPYKVAKTPGTVINRVANGSNVGGPFLHRQQFREDLRPIPQSYKDNGEVIVRGHRWTRKQNIVPLINPPVTYEVGSLSALNDEKVNVYDYYGFPINDVTRGPSFSTANVYYDAAQPDGIGRSGAYTGPLFDLFGNIVMAINPNNTTLVREPIMPLVVDQVNVPYQEHA